jgi:CD109 antigen
MVYNNTTESKLRDAGYGIMNVKTFANWEARMMEEYAMMYDLGPGGSSSEAEIKTRKNFPETWIWDSVNVDENGNASMDKLTIPDTITSWIVTGFGVSETAGLGVAEKSSILAFQDFFIKLQLPYSIKQGEMFKLQATIYNYRSTNSKTVVTLNNDQNDFTIDMGVDQTVTIGANSAHTTTWIITPNKSGVIPINVRAVVENNVAGDQIERLLIVKPEGIPDSQIQNGLLQDNDETIATVEFPSNTVPGSKRVEVRMFGNVLANTLENIDALLKMPYGCGEQNMYNFAPSAFIYEYLNKTGQLTQEIEDKAFKIMQTGYQRELTYRHSDGGYSAFGEQSYYGDEKKAASTVLTSFVAKCFQIANRLSEDDLIDDNVVAQDLEWLAQQFQEGRFVENGRVFSSQLMGGLNKDGNVAITAYATIVFAENYENLKQDYKTIVEEAAASMVSELDNADLSDHTVSMICYILHLINHPSKSTALNKILGRATEKAGYLQWIVDNGWKGPQANVEIASYVLLSYSQLDTDSMLADALPVFMGVQKEMTETGGFSSTQDTVLGLQAMTSYAALMTAANTNIDINIIGVPAIGVESTMGNVQITEEDAMIVRVQNIDLTDDITSVKLASSGSGTIYTQLVLHYYVDENEIKPFEVEFEYSNDVIKRRSVDSEESKDICIKITAKSVDEDTGSGMTLIMVEHASGYTYKSHEEIGTSGKIKKFEPDADKTTFYFDDLLEERELKFCMQYVEAVANPRPVFVSVQDYYNPSAKADTKVELLSRQGEDACDVCGCACSECFDRFPSCTALDDDSGDDTNENIITSKLHFRRTYPKGPKPEINLPPFPPNYATPPNIPVNDFTATIITTTTDSTTDYAVEQVKEILKPLEALPSIKQDKLNAPKEPVIAEVSLRKLAEAAENMSMPKK